MSWFPARDLAALAGAFVAFLSATPAGADEISFAGKKVDMYIGAAAGGGTDLSSRLLGEFIVKHLPGQPSIIYRNIPGGQGVKALNHFATRVKPDGLGIAGGSQAHIDPGSRQQSAVEYDPLSFIYIGGISRGGTVFVLRKGALARLADPAAKPVVVPALEIASTGPQMALWGKEYLGWNVKIVLGYGGTPAMILAARQGEADAMASSSTLQLQPLLDDPEFVPYVQFGDLDNSGKFVERPSFAGVPIFETMIESKLPQAYRKIFEAWLQTQYVDKWFALPPKTPPAYVAAYVEAFRKAMEDKEFIRQARLQFGDDFKSISAQNMTQLVKGMVENSDIVLQHMLELRRKHGLPTE
jgi:hypothetical protein